MNYSSGRIVKERASVGDSTGLPDPHILTVLIYPEKLYLLVHKVESHDRSPILASETAHDERKEIPSHTSLLRRLGRSSKPIRPS